MRNYTENLAFKMKNDVKIEEVICWMDGGSVTLKMKKNESLKYEVEFIQKASLTNLTKLPLPGSFLLNRREIEIRSELEKEILLEIKNAKFGAKIIESEKDLLKKIITESVEFVESENYINIAKKVGRIK